MAEIKAEICKIEQVFVHDNADSLEIAQVKGWTCIIGKGSFKAGDLCLYIPVDACIPPAMEEALFPKDAKIQLTNGRIKAIRIRKVVSQGLVADPKKFKLEKKKEGYDATAELGITKYEPPAPDFQGFSGPGKKAQKKVENPDFHKYTSIENIKNHWKIFEPEDEVYVTEKLHGTNWRAGWVTRVAKTWLERLWLPFAQVVFEKYRWEFIVGSHNVQLEASAKNLYCNIARKYDIKNKLDEGQILYGEVIGPGIQKNFDYGLKEPALVIFDIKSDGTYESFEAVQNFGEDWGVPVVPVLAEGKISDLNLDALAQGASIYCPAQKVREGGVIRMKRGEASSKIGRKVLKLINPEYLMLKHNTDFH